MRSSKSRSRSKNNRNRNSNSLGNVVNRVFDSSGPEGKVRGTPQQIIDKYNQLARDAALANDRVAAENFQQHAEHYLRLLAEAQREQDARREQQEREDRERQAQRDRERAERDAQQQADKAEKQARHGGGNGGGKHDAGDNSDAQQPRAEPASEGAAQPEVLDLGTEDRDTGLVETPENRPEQRPEARSEDKPKKPRAPRRPRNKPTEGGDKPSSDGGEATADAPAQDKPKRRRAPKAAKPDAQSQQGEQPATPAEPPQDAAE